VNTSHPGLLDARRRRRGISVIEFVMAAALILGVLVASGVTLANVERSLAVSRARDGATLLAANILTQAAQFKCQLEVDPQTASGAWKRCVEALRGETLPSSVVTTNPAGDLFFTAKFPTGCTPAREATAQKPATPGCTEYRALLTSRWLRTAGDPAQCQNPLKQPTLLRRTLELRWRPVSATEDVVYKLTTLQAVPSSSAFDATIRRGLLVRGTPGTVATLERGTEKISRVLEACTTTGASPQATGEAWFPFLPAPVSATDYSLSIGASIDWSASNFPVFGAGSNVTNFSNPIECPSAAGEIWTSSGMSCAVGQ
jgi:hypothetical protein